MREIKFRCRTKRGTWVYFGLQDLVNVYAESAMMRVDINDLTDNTGVKCDDFNLEDSEQYTGLKDKNGKEIYEGDIVNHIDMLSRIVRTSEVYFCDGEFRIWKSEHADEMSLCDCHLMMGQIEIIGNIHENPELLEKEE